MQTFLTNNKTCSYFVVADEHPPTAPHQLPPLPAPPSSPRSSLTPAQQLIADSIAEKMAASQTQHERRLQQVDREQATQDRTGWWTLNQWPAHFAGHNMVSLASASRRPDKDELLLQEAVRVVELTFHRSVAGLGTLHRETRRWLRSPRASDPDTRPLTRLQEAASHDRYHGYWKRFICYSIRVWHARQSLRDTADWVLVRAANDTVQEHRVGRLATNEAREGMQGARERPVGADPDEDEIDNGRSNEREP